MTAELHSAVLDAVWNDGDPWVVLRPVRDHTGAVVDLEYVLANDTAVAVVGLGPLVGRRVLELVPEAREHLFPHFCDVLASGRPGDLRVPSSVRRGMSTWRAGWTAVEARVSGEVLVVHWRDVTEEVANAEAARCSQRRLTALVENGSDVAAVVGADGTVTYVTPAVERVLGRSVLEESIFATVHPDHLELAQTVFEELLRGEPGQVVELHVQVQHAEGHWMWVHVRASNYVADPAVGGVVVNWRDVTEQHALAERLRREALHDPLTGLQNRRFFTAELDRALARTQRDEGNVGVVFCDVDHFKAVNDSLGHPAGDELLRSIANRLRHAVRPADVVARIGGDEFVVLAEDLQPDLAQARGELHGLADRIRTALRGTYRVGGRDTTVTTTLGGAVGRDPLGSAELLAQADDALYEAKRFGRDRFELFDQDLHRRNRERLDLEAALRRALGGGELRVYYQPQVDLATGRTPGAEALLRWDHPVQGLMLPAQFLPMAEDCGLIVDVGAWTLTAAMTGAVGWGADGRGPRPSVSVNLSGRQLAHPGLLDDIEAALAVSGLPPSRFQVELTETTALGDLRATHRVLSAVRDRGVGVVLDDFGTGYSSLTWLQRLPVDTVKLDRSVITGLGGDATARTVVGAVTAVAHALEKTVVAEGVETRAQHLALSDLGCDRAQGYLYGAPAEVFTVGTAPGG